MTPGRVLHHNADSLAQRFEGSFNLIHAGMVIQIEEPIHHGLGNAHAGCKIDFAQAGGAELTIELDFGGLPSGGGSNNAGYSINVSPFLI